MRFTARHASLLLGLVVPLSAAADISLETGWNLLGSTDSAGITVATRLNDATTVQSVWKWNQTAGKWAFYAPSFKTPALLATYAQSKGYDVLTNIGFKEGYWVNATAKATLTAPSDLLPPPPMEGDLWASMLNETDLFLGWNLVASTDNKIASDLSTALEPNLKVASKAISTLWAWDTTSSKWKFFTPSLSADALTTYVDSKGYIKFPTAIGPTDGFWVNVVTAHDATTPSVLLRAIRLTDTGISATQCYAVGSHILVSCTGTTAKALNDKQDGMVGLDFGTPKPSYSAVGVNANTDCIKDDVTGLTWEGIPATGTHIDTTTKYTNYAKASVGYASAGDASKYVDDVNALTPSLCGHADWRLPTVDELQSLVNYGKGLPGPAIDATKFPNTQAAWYWTSMSDIRDDRNAWGVLFNDGGISVISRSSLNYVRLVR